MVSVAIPVVGQLPEAWNCSPQADGLIDRAKKGEQAAFLSLFQTHAPRIYDLSLRLTPDIAAAENLTRDIFVEAFASLDEVRNDQAFAAYLYRRAATTMIARRAAPVGA
jgi:DNA-directed RNA polymerase specialized sigma24 family protein